MTRSRSLRSRVAVAAALGATVVVLLLAALAWAVLSRNEYQQLDRRLSAVAEVVSPTTTDAPGTYLVTIRRGGRVLTTDGSPLPALNPGTTTTRIGGRTYRVLTVQPPERPNLLISVGAPVAGTRAAVNRLRWEIAGVSAMAIALAAVLGWQFAGRAVRPLRRLTAQAREVGEGPAAVHAEGAAETEELAGEITDMLRRLHESRQHTAAALQTAQDFAAAARHELRTPLTAMRTDLEVLAMTNALSEQERSEVIADLLRAQSRVQDTLTALGQLASGDLADPAARTELDVTELLHRVAEEAMRTATGVSVSVREGPPVIVIGWEAGLRLAVENLVRNAVRHGRALRVELAAARREDTVELTVDDDGTGIPADECVHVFGRFTRGSNAVGAGSGLGLALVAQQAALHGGSARLAVSPLGGVRAILVIRSS